jgi:hypothetical protein
MSEHLIECGLASLADFHPGHVSSAVSAGLRKLHPSKPVTSNTAPNAAGQFAPSVRLRCKRQGHLPDRRQRRPPIRPLRGESHPEEFPALKTASIGLRRRWTSSANQKPDCTVASLPSRILRSRFAGCDPP